MFVHHLYHRRPLGGGVPSWPRASYSSALEIWMDDWVTPLLLFDWLVGLIKILNSTLSETPTIPPFDCYFHPALVPISSSLEDLEDHHHQYRGCWRLNRSAFVLWGKRRNKWMRSKLCVCSGRQLIPANLTGKRTVVYLFQLLSSFYYVWRRKPGTFRLLHFFIFVHLNNVLHCQFNETLIKFRHVSD